MTKYSMEKLVELHDKIKDHPYRHENSAKYLDSYKELLCELAYCFYDVIKGTKYNIASNLTHDLVTGALNIERNGYEKYQKENDLHVEYCIQTIHRFIETGRVDEFPDFNMHALRPILGLTCFYKWYEGENKFHMKVPKDKVDSVVRVLNKSLKDYEQMNISGLNNGVIGWFKDEIRFIEESYK